MIVRIEKEEYERVSRTIIPKLLEDIKEVPVLLNWDPTKIVGNIVKYEETDFDILLTVKHKTLTALPLAGYIRGKFNYTVGKTYSLNYVTCLLNE